MCPCPAGAGVVKQSALVDAMRRRLAYVPPAPKPAKLPEPVTIPVRYWHSHLPRLELQARGYKVVGMPPAAHATSLDYLPTADRWLDEHEHDLRAVYRDVPKREILSIIWPTLCSDWRGPMSIGSWGMRSSSLSIKSSMPCWVATATNRSARDRSGWAAGKASRPLGSVAHHVGDR